MELRAWVSYVPLVFLEFCGDAPQIGSNHEWAVNGIPSGKGGYPMAGERILQE